MIKITLDKLGKKFNREWIFRNVALEINAGDKLVILGGNGSGKSTLLQVISGYVTPNEGTLHYHKAEKIIDPEIIRNYIGFASPYIQLIEDFTIIELIEHISLYKPFIAQKTAIEILDICELNHARSKYIRQFSSGMKQRLKLGLAVLADVPVILLDEPVSNLDKNAIAWYRKMIGSYAQNRTVIVCSNAIEEEYFFCDKQINVADYKIKV